MKNALPDWILHPFKSQPEDKNEDDETLAK
jgi:hypothetical protein